MPVIHINCKAGKSDDEKRLLYKKISDACVDVLGCSPEVVEIFWHEITDNNFSRAGKMLLDIEKDK
jgi:4-oxalocrotonate tautomerase